jgi:hypothetical protein
MKVATLIAAAALCIGPLHAQWINYPTPGIPRTPDGKPNLSAPAPRTTDGKPDFSGLWRHDQNGEGETEKAIEAMQPQPWADALSKKRKEDLFKDDMSVLCLPLGPRASVGVRKVVQTPTLIVILENDLTYRQVFLDGRPLPSDPNPNWMGYSVGHWEGDTLVIESAGFNDRTWLDDRGHPHTESLHITERLHRPDFGHLEIDKTIDDPKALAKPLTVPINLELDADTEIIEYVCAENERDRQHLVGKVTDETKNAVKVAPEILAKYTGVYDFKVPERPNLNIILTVTLDGDHLMVDMNGGVKRPLTPLSETKFFFLEAGGSVEFAKNDQGAVTDMIIGAVEGTFKAIRRAKE